MSDIVTAASPPIPKLAAQPRKSARKSLPPQFPHRITFCMAADQVENLQQIKKVYRASESFVLRMAFDTFCRTNGFPMNGGEHG